MSTSRHPPTWLPLLLGLGLGLTSATQAQSPPSTPAEEPAGSGISVSWSGFGTIGWARSNRNWTYQRFIARDGSLKRDTVFGGQMDLRLGDHWSAAVQLKIAPDERRDHGWRIKPAWAFVAWRPDNDWLVRAGRLRVPFFLRSEQMDVGVTYDEVRLLPEIYAIVPTTDFVGAHVTRSWSTAAADLNVDVYAGRARQTQRLWLREGIPGMLAGGADFRNAYTDAAGAVGTWAHDASRWRIGMHRVKVRLTGGLELPQRPVWAELVPGTGIGYWQTEPSQPGPGVSMAAEMVNDLFIVGGEFNPAPAWRLIGEVGRILQRNTERSVDSLAAYVSALHDIGAFTPYATLSRVKSSGRSLYWARQLDSTTVPDNVDPSGLLNASMRVAADSVPVYDQWSLALGTSYTLSPSRKIKAEWLRTLAHAPGLFDVSRGEPLFRHRTVDVLSLNYNFVF